jgi:hypothetical protein
MPKYNAVREGLIIIYKNTGKIQSDNNDIYKSVSAEIQCFWKSFMDAIFAIYISEDVRNRMYSIFNLFIGVLGITAVSISSISYH